MKVTFEYIDYDENYERIYFKEEWTCYRWPEFKDKKEQLLEMARRWDESEEKQLPRNPYATEWPDKHICTIELGLSIEFKLVWPELKSWTYGAEHAIWMYGSRREIELADKVRQEEIISINNDFKKRLREKDYTWFSQTAREYERKQWEEEQDFINSWALTDTPTVDTQTDPDGGTWYFHENQGTWLEDPPEY